MPKYQITLIDKTSGARSTRTIDGASIEEATAGISPRLFDVETFRELPEVDDPQARAESQRPPAGRGSTAGDMEPGLAEALPWKHAPASLLTGLQLYRVVRDGVAMGILYSLLLFGAIVVTLCLVALAVLAVLRWSAGVQIV